MCDQRDDFVARRNWNFIKKIITAKKILKISKNVVNFLKRKNYKKK